MLEERTEVHIDFLVLCSLHLDGFQPSGVTGFDHCLAGVGKSTLVNHWLRRMAAKHYRPAELVFGWSFYRQGSSGDTSSADEFLDAALKWFGDPDPRLGTAWEKGERLAKLVAHRRTLLVLDGLEPLQNPPGPREGRVREPSLKALLRELAAFNAGLCVITTRTPVADIVDHEGASALRRDLDQLASDTGAKLLRALGVRGSEAELRSASNEFSGHCLALTLLGSYLTDAYDGDIRCRNEVSEHLAEDVRQGAHARYLLLGQSISERSPAPDGLGGRCGFVSISGTGGLSDDFSTLIGSKNRKKSKNLGGACGTLTKPHLALNTLMVVKKSIARCRTRSLTCCCFDFPL